MGRLMASDTERIMVIGRPDTGKTTLVERLLRASIVPPALADLELGQSHVGPPAMLGWGYWRNEYRSLEDIGPERLFFVGVTSPLWNPKAALEGARVIVEDASRHVGKVVIDTSGAVDGGFAVRLKLDKIEAVGADVVVALQRHAELEPILEEVRKQRLAQIELPPVAEDVTGKTPAERREYRRRRFAEYFESASLKRLALSELRVVKYSAADAIEREGRLLRGLLVGLVEPGGRHAGMGVLQGRDNTRGELLVLTPVSPRVEISALIPGRMILGMDGSEKRVQVGGRS